MSAEQPINIVDGFEFYPVNAGRWHDFETLFGERGACAGCWCMWWRIRRSEFEKNKGEKNKKAMRSIILGGEVPGILAYWDGQPVGWCSVAPRDQYSVLERSRILKPLDSRPVWSVVCFFIDKRFRKQGLTVNLLKAATIYVKQNGGNLIEGYPVEPQKRSVARCFRLDRTGIRFSQGRI